jgi:hypothetical protein
LPPPATVRQFDWVLHADVGKPEAALRNNSNDNLSQHRRRSAMRLAALRPKRQQ